MAVAARRLAFDRLHRGAEVLVRRTVLDVEHDAPEKIRRQTAEQNRDHHRPLQLVKEGDGR